MILSKACFRCGEEKSLDNFYNDKSKADGKKPSCKKCEKEISKASYLKNKEAYLRRGKEKGDNNRDRNRKLIYDLTGFICAYCGFKHTSTAPFDWHHINPREKEVSIGNLMRRSNTEVLLNEISKCVFLCKNCHFIEHERLRLEGKNVEE